MKGKKEPKTIDDLLQSFSIRLTINQLKHEEIYVSTVDKQKWKESKNEIEKHEQIQKIIKSIYQLIK